MPPDDIVHAMDKKRILIVGPLPPPLGGDTVSTLNLSRSRHWKERGMLVEVVNTSAGDRVRVEGESLTPGDLARGARIFVRVLASIPRTDVFLLWANSRFLCTLGLVIMRLARICGKPVVVEGRVEGLPKPRRHRIRKGLSKADLILPQTGLLRRWLVDDLGLEPSRVVQAPNFIPDELLTGELDERAPGGRCVFVGQIKREKGVFEIIEAVGGRDGIGCDFYGPIVNRDRDSFLEAVEATENVSYGGEVEPDRIGEALEGYDILLLPTYHGGEGYPAVILEAFAAAVPVITTRWRSIPEIIEDEVNGLLVPVRSPDALRAAIRRLATDQELYRVVRANAFRFVRSFSEERVVRDIVIQRIERILKPGK
jgi:glycosyltransferase involved in cell wall biosynthesis